MSLSDDDSFFLGEASQLIDGTTKYLCRMNCSIFAQTLERLQGSESDPRLSLQRKWIKFAKRLSGMKSLRSVMTFMLAAKLSIQRTSGTLAFTLERWRSRVNKKPSTTHEKWQTLRYGLVRSVRRRNFNLERKRLLSVRAQLAAAALIELPDFSKPNLDFLFQQIEYDQQQENQVKPKRRIEVIEIESPRKVVPPPPVLVIETQTEHGVDRALVSDDEDSSDEPKHKNKKPSHRKESSPRKESKSKKEQNQLPTEIPFLSGTNQPNLLLAIYCLMLGYALGQSSAAH